MFIIVIVSLRKLISGEDDRNSSEKYIIDLNSLGEVKYNQTNLFNFFVISK